MLLRASAGVICSSIVLPFYSLGELVVPMIGQFGWPRGEFQLALLFSTGAGVITAKYFGLEHYAKIYAVFYAALALASGVAPMLFARVFDITTSYDIGFLIGAGLFALGSVMVLSLGQYPQINTA